MGILQPTAVQRASISIHYSCIKKGLEEWSPLRVTCLRFQWSMLPGNRFNSKSILISLHMYSKCIIQTFNIFLNSLWLLRTITICFCPSFLFTHSFVFAISFSFARRRDEATARSGASYQSLPAGVWVFSFKERGEAVARLREPSDLGAGHYLTSGCQSFRQ